MSKPSSRKERSKNAKPRGPGKPFKKGNPGRRKGSKNKRTKQFEEFAAAVEEYLQQGDKKTKRPPTSLIAIIAMHIMSDPTTARWFKEMLHGKPRQRMEVEGSVETVKVYIGADMRELMK